MNTTFDLISRVEEWSLSMRQSCVTDSEYYWFREWMLILVKWWEWRIFSLRVYSFLFYYISSLWIIWAYHLPSGSVFSFLCVFNLVIWFSHYRFNLNWLVSHCKICQTILDGFMKVYVDTEVWKGRMKVFFMKRLEKYIKWTWQSLETGWWKKNERMEVVWKVQ